jgi:DNA-directed RNA polymerase subunit RPC12/RpoP
MDEKSIEVKINGHTVTLIVYECEGCQGAIGVDHSYLDQVDNEIKCPYCGVSHKVR